jgi:hypothetical protein
MPLADVYGAVIDRTVPGQITLTLDEVSLTLPWDGGKPTLSDATAVFEFINQYIGITEQPNGSLWAHRHQYARMAYKILAYQDLWDTLDAERLALPGPQRAEFKRTRMDPLLPKMGRFPTLRDQYKALAGE